MDTTTKLKVGFAALMILSGIGVASYPVISNAVAQRHASEAIQNYDDTVKHGYRKTGRRQGGRPPL